VSQLRPYHATLSDDVLEPHEFIVDTLRDRRVRNGSTEYLVKWRGHSITKSTWEPRAKLLRRCADLISEYDASAPPALIPPVVLT
jgi:hypothetical protein